MGLRCVLFGHDPYVYDNPYSNEIDVYCATCGTTIDAHNTTE